MIPAVSRVVISRRRGSMMESTRGSTRYFSDGKGRVLSEEERAKETVFIQKMERERLEKQKKHAEKEKLEKEKGSAEKNTEGTHKG
ncbi:hypothetical protein SLEP1_g47468 [Rubroshorea leprosula]|uniref:ATPase inhibitor n=1 Tax=Rubroshorea leprosula TaxID=152421 RepID=A0AAV5LT97_9ROSI|nr:hypothetical protein SLEP1_g47468 [Rubroshorea leprosula]